MFSIVAGSYYSPGSYAKSINCEDSDLEEENLGEEENCLSSNKKLSCNKKNVNCNSATAVLPGSLSNSSSFEFTGGNNLFSAQTNVNFTNASKMSTSTPPIVAVAQAITSSNDILTTNCSVPLSKGNPLQANPTLNSLNNAANPPNGLEYANSSSTNNNTMTPIDKLYSMQSSYFNSAPDCGENCVATN